MDWRIWKKPVHAGIQPVIAGDGFTLRTDSDPLAVVYRSVTRPLAEQTQALQRRWTVILTPLFRKPLAYGSWIHRAADGCVSQQCSCTESPPRQLAAQVKARTAELQELVIEPDRHGRKQKKPARQNRRFWRDEP